MSIGIGLAVNNTKAVFEALFHKPSEFARTPKYHIEGGSDEWIGKKYRQSVAMQPMIEVALGPVLHRRRSSTRSPTASTPPCRS